jgi:nicotinamide mononucleotide transporter
MNSFLNQFIEQLIATSWLEWVAVTGAIAYLLLAIRESLWCWPAAFVSTSIYIFLFFDVNLYMESLLNIYYLVMAVYGWQQWHKKNDNHASVVIHRWPFQFHIKTIAVTSVLVLCTAFLLQRYTNQSLAFADSFTTGFAILATYMVTQKVLENWLYWLVIDAVSIYIYLSKGFALTSILFLLYIILAAYGWIAWKRLYVQQNKPTT